VKALVCGTRSGQSGRVPLLTEDAYKATMGAPMTLLQPGDGRPVRLDDYVKSISDDDLEGHDFSSRDVAKVYREPTGRWIHVLVACGTPNVYLVVVVDEPGVSVYGHYLLDLNREYDIDQRPNL
jgi:hypothetical protein